MRIVKAVLTVIPEFLIVFPCVSYGSRVAPRYDVIALHEASLNHIEPLIGNGAPPF